jgi:hypothetical protein
MGESDDLDLGSMGESNDLDLGSMGESDDLDLGSIGEEQNIVAKEIATTDHLDNQATASSSKMKTSPESTEDEHEAGTRWNKNGKIFFYFPEQGSPSDLRVSAKAPFLLGDLIQGLEDNGIFAVTLSAKISSYYKDRLMVDLHFTKLPHLLEWISQQYSITTSLTDNTISL